MKNVYNIKMSSGKHMICDIKKIKNLDLLNSPTGLLQLLDHISETNKFTILEKTKHEFKPQGFTALYLLSESHISIHTFPEHQYAAIDIYTCKTYPDNQIYLDIYDYLIKELDADKTQKPVIIDRTF